MGVRLHLKAFCLDSIPQGPLKLWYLARYWDPEGTGACLFDFNQAARLLGVKVESVRRYFRDGLRLGFFRVLNGQYVRYTATEVLAGRYNFNSHVVIETPVSILRRPVKQIATFLATFYGQYRAQCAVRNRKTVAPRTMMQVKGRSKISPYEILTPPGDLVLDNCNYGDAKVVGDFPFTNQNGELRRAKLVQVELMRYSSYCRGNTTNRIIRHEKKGNHRYVFVNAARIATYSVSQKWVGAMVGLSQAQVSKYLKEVEHYQVRELVPNPQRTFNQLRKHEGFNPEKPWWTEIPAKPAGEAEQEQTVRLKRQAEHKKAERKKKKRKDLKLDTLKPGAYALQRLGNLFSIKTGEDLSNAYVLTREVASVYHFKGFEVKRSWRVNWRLRLEKNKKKDRRSTS